MVYTEAMKQYQKDYYQRPEVKARHKINLQKWRKNNKPREKELARKRQQTEKYRAKNRIWQREYREKLKFGFILKIGTKCQKCGKEVSKENLAIFDFHHIDETSKTNWHYPNSKNRGAVRNVMKKDYELLFELWKEEKIMLLCANCHRLEHYKHGKNQTDN